MLARALNSAVRQPGGGDLCLEFNGTNNNVTIPSLGSVSSFSVAYWAEADAWANDELMFDCQSGRLVIATEDGYYKYYNTSWRSSGIAVLSGWHHYAWDFGSSACHLSVDDGTYTGSLSGLSISALNGTTKLGSRYTSEKFWPGKVGDFRVYDGVLSASEITDLYENYAQPVTTSSSLLLWYKFAEGTADAAATGANSIIDSSGNGYHGTPVNSPIYRAVA